MTGIPTTYAMTVIARQRRDELHAQAARLWLVKLAGRRGAVRQQRADWPVAAMAVTALAPLLAAPAATDLDASWQARNDPASAAGRVVSQLLEEHFLDPGAARW
jgi:hypothetical protein